MATGKHFVTRRHKGVGQLRTEGERQGGPAVATGREPMTSRQERLTEPDDRPISEAPRHDYWVMESGEIREA